MRVIQERESLNAPWTSWWTCEYPAKQWRARKLVFVSLKHQKSLSCSSVVDANKEDVCLGGDGEQEISNPECEWDNEMGLEITCFPPVNGSVWGNPETMAMSLLSVQWGVIIVVVALFCLNESENRLTFHLTVSAAAAAKGLIRIRFYANAHEWMNSSVSR